MDRTIIDPLEQMRDFDFVMAEHDALVGLGSLAQDILSQLNLAATSQTVVAGVAASQTSTPSLTVNLGPGRVYTLAAADATATGSIPQDLTTICQQGISAAQSVTLVPPTAGQSQWNLIQCQFQQGDTVRPNDPTNGVVPFYNASNPTIPNPTTINTVRQGRLIVQVISGAAAATGSETPPQPTNNWSPLYLVDLAGGQTQITNGQILTAGPSVGTGVPANYPRAPLLAGLLASHHSGAPGQAPKINLASEVQGILPYANMSPVRTLLSAPLNLYVNGSTGNDSNPGTSPSLAFRTINAAVSSSYHNYDFNGNSLTINVANGAYSITGTNTWTASFIGQPLGCTTVNLIGNINSPGSVTLTGTTANGVQVGLGANVQIQGVTIAASGTANGVTTFAGVGLYCSQGLVSIFNSIIGSCGYAQIQCTDGVVTFGTQPMSFTGTTPTSLLSTNGGQIWLQSSTVTVTGLTITGAALQNGFAVAYQSGAVNAANATFIGSATGQKFAVSQAASIFTNGAGANFFPGSTSGLISSATFGVYG